MAELAELIARFLVVGATAFGGGGAALPLVERITVADTGWLTPQQFAVGVGFAYATPGPVLILAAFVGFYVAGITGALAATLAVFAVPVLLAVTAVAIARPVFDLNPGLLAGAALVLAAERFGASPVLLLAIAAAAGAAVGAVGL